MHDLTSKPNIIKCFGVLGCEAWATTVKPADEYWTRALANAEKEKNPRRYW